MIRGDARKKKISVRQYFLAASCCGLLLLQGCAPMILVAGAGAGYLAADKKAARKVEKFFHDLGKSSHTSSRRISGSRHTGKKHPSKKSTAASVRLQKTSLKPSDVARGKNLAITIRYDVSGGSAKELTVTKKKELWFNNKRLAVLQDESVTRKNGTWESRLVFKFPESAAQGTYTVKQSITFKGKTKQSNKTFKVL